MTLHECTGEGCVANPEAIASLIDGSQQVGMATALDQSELRARRLLDQVRFVFEVLGEIHELTEPRSKTPLQDMQMIRVKASVAIRAVEKSGLLS
jgi:hypothetical protein